MRNRIIIAGIDPGTTSAYAVLDIKGNVIETKSSRGLCLNLMIAEITKLGKVIAVGTDKAKIPGVIEAFSSKTGSAIIGPGEDLKVEVKKELALAKDAKDTHQMDALASALFAYKSLSPLISRIERFAEENSKADIAEKIMEMVITRGISIKHAAYILEHPEKEDAAIVKKVIEEKKLEQKDFFILSNKLRTAERENDFLKEQNKRLARQMKLANSTYDSLARKASAMQPDKKSQELLSNRDKRIKIFGFEMMKKDSEIGKLKKEIMELNGILSQSNNSYVIKKLDNLGMHEYERKKGIIRLTKGDFLLVHEPNIFNERVVSLLKGGIKAVCHVKELSAQAKNLPFVFLDCSGVRLHESAYFAIADKKDIDCLFQKSNMIEKVIAEYKEKRVIGLYN